jgi:glycosyltransferase involved in cell wall biosynthesis
MKVSVCIPTYNGSKFIKQQIDSILSQLSPNDELLVADDGSDDSTVNILNTYDKVKILSLDRVGGVVKNIERLISAASGDIIVLADQDDVWLPGRVDLIKIELFHYDLIMLNGFVVDANLKLIGVTIFDFLKVKKGFFNNVFKNSFVGCCIAFRRKLKPIILPFPEYIPWHDWYIGLVAELSGTVGRIVDETILYRRHDSNHTLTGLNSRNSFFKKILIRFLIIIGVIYSLYFRYYLKRSLYCMLSNSIYLIKKIISFFSLKLIYEYGILILFRHKWLTLEKSTCIKLNLGSGPQKGRDGWVTVDIKGADISHNLKYGIPLNNDSVDIIYCSHLLEHIPYTNLSLLILECFRVLKKGGLLSVAVPNAGFYIDAYSSKKFFRSADSYYQPYIVNTGSYMDQLNYIAYMGGEHCYLFDEQNLQNTLRIANFSNVKLREFDPTLDYLERDFESIYAEAIK